MTEAERIFREGWLPEAFWEEEVRCGYRISSEIKKVWAIEMDLYREFARVCEQYGLTYFTDGGTTLGAIRHEGFIPWDDDFDVCMPRASYEKLKTLASAFQSPYFFQNAFTDPAFGYSFMRLRNSNTTVVTEPFTHCRFNQGICLDIFPLDKVTEEDYLPRRKKMYELIMKNSAYMRYDFPHKSKRDEEMIAQYYDSSASPVDTFRAIEELAMQDEDKETDFVSLLVSTQYDASKKIWPRRIFEGFAEKPFESIKVRVPIGYEEQLRIYFGNYMEYPPVEERGEWHTMRFYPDIPYRRYYRETYGLYYD